MWPKASVTASDQHRRRCGRPLRAGAARPLPAAAVDLRRSPDRASRWSRRGSIPPTGSVRPHVVGHRRSLLVPSARDACPSAAKPHHPVSRGAGLGPFVAGSRCAHSTARDRDLTPTPTSMLTVARRLDWAVLLRRVFGDQVTQCPRCQDHVRVLAFLSDPVVTARILEHLDIASEPVAVAPARAGPGRRRVTSSSSAAESAPPSPTGDDREPVPFGHFRASRSSAGLQTGHPQDPLLTKPTRIR